MSSVFALVASAVIIAGGLAAAVRAIFRFVFQLRDNTAATKQLTTEVENLTATVESRFDSLLRRVSALERGTRDMRRFRNQ